MKIIKNKVATPEGTVLNVLIDGRIDATNAEEFRDSISTDLKRVKVLNLDFQNVDYISSVGIRSLLLLFKQMRRQDGRMEIIISDIGSKVCCLTQQAFCVIGDFVS